MSISKGNASVFVCRSYQSAEKAVTALRAAGYSVRNLSVIGKDYPGVVDDAAAPPPEGMKRSLVEVRSFWCRIWRLLRDDAFLSVEGIGSVVVAGSMTEPVLATLRTPRLLEVRNPLRAGMRAVGIDKSNLTTYEEALQSDCFLVIARGNQVEIDSAARILRSCEEEGADKQPHRRSA